MIEINLLPGARRKRGGKAAGLKLPDLKVLVTAVKDPWLIAFVASWLVFGAVLGLVYLPRRARVAELVPRLAAVEREASRMNRVLAQLRMFEAQRESLLSQIAVIRQIDRERYIWPHILDAVTKALPPYTWLDELASRAGDGDSASGNTAVQLTGKSADIQAVTRFVRDLEASLFLRNVVLVSTGLVLEQGREVHSFTVTAQYDPPDSTLITMQPLAATLVQSMRSGGGRR